MFDPVLRQFLRGHKSTVCDSAAEEWLHMLQHFLLSFIGELLVHAPAYSRFDTVAANEDIARSSGAIAESKLYGTRRTRWGIRHKSFPEVARLFPYSLHKNVEKVRSVEEVTCP